MKFSQSEIRMLQMTGEHDKALNKLLKIKMSNVELNLSDEVFVNHCIAWFYYKKNDDLKYYYIGLNKRIFEDKKTQKDNKVEYAKHLWLYVDIYEEKLDTKEYVDIFIEIYKTYKSVNNEYFCNCAILKILIRKKSSRDVINFIKHSVEKGRGNVLINDMVEECLKLDYHTYINVRQLVATR